MKPTKLQQKESGSASLTIERVIQGIESGEFRNVVFMVGAGISTSAGIPDFRTPGTGLYSNLERLMLPYPEAVFDIEYLRERPTAFYTLAKELFPGKFDPTDFHHFMKWVESKGALRRVYTQNIDTLERLAGISPDKIVEAHGSFAGSHCIDCSKAVSTEVVRKEILNNYDAKDVVVPKCPSCSGIVKPDIVFFGEGLPDKFFDCMDLDFETPGSKHKPDLVIVAGTSLQVHPFAQLPDMVDRDCVRVLINTEKVGTLGRRAKDVVVLGDLKYINELLPESGQRAKSRKDAAADSEDANDSEDVNTLNERLKDLTLPKDTKEKDVTVGTPGTSRSHATEPQLPGPAKEGESVSRSAGAPPSDTSGSGKDGESVSTGSAGAPPSDTPADTAAPADAATSTREATPAHVPEPLNKLPDAKKPNTKD